MRVWLIKTGEDLPIDGKNVRLLRVGLLARLLVDRGHEVTWWDSCYRHSKKTQRFDQDTYIEVEPNFHIHLLHAPGYKKNVSLARVINHKVLGSKFKKFARREPKPDVIFCGVPIMEFAAQATRFGRDNNVPVILDIRDMWPDIFLDLFPKKLELVARVLLNPVFISMKKSYARATAICGISPVFVEKGLNYAKRLATPFDRDFPLAYISVNPGEAAISKAWEFWKQRDLSPNDNRSKVCFFGAWSPRSGLPTMIRAAKLILAKRKDVVFVICGNGENIHEYKTLANGCPNIIFPGWVEFPEIWTLMRMSSFGVIPYYSTDDLRVAIPNKVIEYLSAGLPILSSINCSILEEMLNKHECGITFPNMDHAQLANIICDCLNDPSGLEKMSRNASTLFQEKFVAEKVYPEMVEYIEGVAAFSKCS